MIKLRLHPRHTWLAACYTHHQQEVIFEMQLQDVLENTRWYLDNLDNMVTYRVSWSSYHKGDTTIPFRLVRETKRRGKGGK